MKAAKLYKINGDITAIIPANGKNFTLKELQGYVGGTIDIQDLPKDKEIIILDDNGKLTDPVLINERASKIWRRNYPIEEYPHNNDGLIAGDVIICNSKMIK